MSEIAQRIDAVIKVSLGPALREFGFKKKGRTLRRRAFATAAGLESEYRAARARRPQDG